MQSKFKQPNDGWEKLEYDTDGSQFSDGYVQKNEINDKNFDLNLNKIPSKKRIGVSKR